MKNAIKHIKTCFMPGFCRLMSCVALTLLLYTCKPDQIKEEQHFGPFYFWQYADYFWFKPGTYWIYENNRTGELDTCTLVSIQRDTVTEYAEHPDFKRWYTYEQINYNIFTRHRLGIVNYQTLACVNCPNNKVDSTRVMKRNGFRNVFVIPWDNIKNPVEYKYFSTAIIGDSLYKEVYRLDLTDDAGLPFWDDTKLLWGNLNGTADYSSYYWARNVGLIQIKYKQMTQRGWDSAYWTLKEKHLIKQ